MHYANDIASTCVVGISNRSFIELVMLGASNDGSALLWLQKQASAFKKKNAFGKKDA